MVYAPTSGANHSGLRAVITVTTYPSYLYRNCSHICGIVCVRVGSFGVIVSDTTKKKKDARYHDGYCD